MHQVPIKLGPLALLLTIISICLTTLSILTCTTSGADLRLAQKYAETVQTRYSLEREGQAFFTGGSGHRFLGTAAECDLRRIAGPGRRHHQNL